MSKYVDLFKKLREYGDNPEVQDAGYKVLLYGKQILVRLIPETEIKSASGLIMAAPQNQWLNTMNTKKLVFCEVLETGQGYTDANGERRSLDAEPGDIVVVGQNAPLAFTRFWDVPMTNEFQLAHITEDDILWHFSNEATHQTYFNRLKQALNGLQSG